jgi:integrase
MHNAVLEINGDPCQNPVLYMESDDPQSRMADLVKTFRTKRDAEDWSRRTEDEMVRGAFIQRATADRMTVEVALKRYLVEVVPTKRLTSQVADVNRAKILIEHLGKYSLAALTPEIISKFRDLRLAGDDRKDEHGKPRPRANNTVRLDLALLGHLFSVAIKEWGVGLPSNPVFNIRRPSPGAGRNRRLTKEEEMRILAAVDRHSNPMLGWIVRIALATGMRVSEIVTLRREQVDLTRRVVRLVNTKNTQPRTVPLSSEAAKLFHQALNHCIRPSDTDLIFFGEPGRNGTRGPYHFDRMWQNVKRDQGSLLQNPPTGRWKRGFSPLARHFDR